MGRKPFPRNERCPCGSGDKYKRCCFTKGFHYYIDEATGDVVRSVPVSSEARSVLEPALAKQREKFIAKFDREPGPDYPIFFCSDSRCVRWIVSDWRRRRARRGSGRPAAAAGEHKRGAVVATG